MSISNRILNNSNSLYQNEDNMSNKLNTGKSEINQNYSKKNLSQILTKNSNHPRINELISNNIFQHYFKLYYKNQDYTEFKSLNDYDKLYFMIDLFFYIITDASKDFLGDLSLENLNTEQFSNMNNEIIDKLKTIESEFDKKKIIDKMIKYGLYNKNNTNDLNYKFNEIMNKSKNIFYNDDNIKNTEEKYNLTNYTIKERKFINMTNLNFKNNIRSSSSTENMKIPFKNFEQKNVLNTTKSIYNNNHNLSKTNSFLKIDFGKINFEKIGTIKKGNFYDLNDEDIKEILFTTGKYIYFSNNNNIFENNFTNYICNNNFNKLNHPYISPLNYKCLINPKKTNIIQNRNNFFNNSKPIMIEDRLVLSQNNINNIVNNILLIKNKDKYDMNDLLSKLYCLDENIIILNKNEVNKIGILLIKYVQLEKEINNLNTKIYKEKEQIEKLKEIISKYSNSLSDRLNESQKFLQNYK